MTSARTSPPSGGRIQRTTAAGMAFLRWSAWLVAAAVSLAVLTQPVSAQAQLALGVGAIAAMALIWTVLPRGRFTRTLFLAIGNISSSSAMSAIGAR